jgi:hypothetical protein
MRLNTWNIYLRNAIAYVPTVAQAEAGGHLGYFMDVDPVKVVTAAESEALRNAIIEIMSKGNPIVPAPTRGNFPKPVVLKYAKVKSWSAFEKGALAWAISEKDGIFQINPQRKCADRGWEDDPERIEFLPPGTAVNVVAERLASLVQLALRNAV